MHGIFQLVIIGAEESSRFNRNLAQAIPMRVYLLIFFLLLTGCLSTTPGHITVTESEFDGTTQVKMTPAHIESMNQMRLGALWHSKMPEDSLMLIASTQGATRFRSKYPLQFRIGSDTTKLRPTGRSTDIDTRRGVGNSAYNRSKQHFWVNRTFLTELIKAETVYVRMVTDEGITDAAWEKSLGSLGAQQSFKDFFNRVDEVNSGQSQ